MRRKTGMAKLMQMFLCFIIALLAFTSCNKDEDNGGDNHPAEFVGQWSMIQSVYIDDEQSTQRTTTYDENQLVLVLDGDGTGREAERTTGGSYDVYGGYVWNAGNGQFSIDYGDGDGFITYSVNEISATRMVLEFKDEEGRFGGEHTIDTYVKTNIQIPAE